MENPNPYIDKFTRWSSHTQIAAMLEGLPRGARVLDVGAASGTLARACAGRGYVLRGIEPNTDWLANSRSLYSELYEGNLEQTSDAFLEGHEAVVCGDVLEHLVQSEYQLDRLVNAQPAGCIFIISVPNVANLWIRLNMLFGHFDYADKGILDRTHLHFYTRKTILTLLHATELVVIKLEVTPIPLELVAPKITQGRLGQWIYTLYAGLTKFWPSVLGYQWVVKASQSSK